MDIFDNGKSKRCDWTSSLAKYRGEIINELSLELRDSKSKSMFNDCYADKVLKIPNSVHTSYYEVWLVDGKYVQFYKPNGEMIPASLLSTDEMAIILELIKQKKYGKLKNGEISAILS